MSKSSDEHQSNSRLGALAESLTQSFLLEYCDFCFPCQEKHPADLICELGSARYTIQVKGRRRTKESKYVFSYENNRSKSSVYKNYHCDILAFVFFPDKRIMFKPNTSTQNYYTYEKKILKPDLEIESFKDTLKTLTNTPIINPII